MVTVIPNRHLLRLPTVLILFLVSFVSLAGAQLPLSISEEIKGIVLLETDRETVRATLSRDNFTVFEKSGSDEYFRENYNITFSYSTGECRDAQVTDDVWFLGPDVWNVAHGKVVKISIEPKVRKSLAELNLNLSGFKKEKLYPDHNNLYVYFSQDAGTSITVVNDRVSQIDLFPKRIDHQFLCKNERVEQHYRIDRWRFQAGPKTICVLMNLSPDVLDLHIDRFNAASRQFAVSVRAVDFENDVLTYIYKVSGGDIVGSGSKVVWDLNDVGPGSYTITSGVDDGAGPRGKFVSKTVVVN